MTGATWAILAGILALLGVLAVVVVDSRSVRQQLRNREGEVTGLRLDLDAARSRIDELQTYLGDYESWTTEQSLVVPAHLANRAVPDRWSVPGATPRPPASPSDRR